MEFQSNSNAFPKVFLDNTKKFNMGGSFSIYVSYKKNEVVYNQVYRDAQISECSAAKDCSECNRRSDVKSGRPCTWLSPKAGVTDAAHCVDRKAAYDKAFTLRQLVKKYASSALATWKPQATDCAEACYFANMQWAGWSGIYDLGMAPGKIKMASISSGHKYAMNDDVTPFYCEGFNYVDNTKCTFLRANKIRDISTQAGQTQADTCFINNDNPNPCALGSSDAKKWAMSVDGKYYFVTNSLGMLEYVEVGPNGPSKCGTSKTVFTTQAWKGWDASGRFMPNPAHTCKDVTCW